MQVLLSDMAGRAVYLPDGSDSAWTALHKPMLRARLYWQVTLIFSCTPSLVSTPPLRFTPPLIHAYASSQIHTSSHSRLYIHTSSPSRLCLQEATMPTPPELQARPRPRRSSAIRLPSECHPSAIQLQVLVPWGANTERFLWYELRRKPLAPGIVRLVTPAECLRFDP